MRSSSLVGMTQILTLLVGELMTPSLPEACEFEAGSISMPNRPRRSQLAARIAGAFSPIPPVKISPSTFPNTPLYAAMYFRTR